MADQARKIKISRFSVRSDILAVLVLAYNKHFVKYCHCRKQVLQKITSVVWKSVHHELIEEKQVNAKVKGSIFGDRTLRSERTPQNALRAVLKNVQSENVGDAHAKYAFVQGEDLLVKLQKSESFNRKKMTELRQSLIKCGSVPNSHTNASVLERISGTVGAVKRNVSAKQSS